MSETDPGDVVLGVGRSSFSRAHLAELYRRGGENAVKFAVGVIKKQELDPEGKPYKFDEKFVTEINRRLLSPYAVPEVAGQLRDPSDNGTEINGRPAVSGRVARMRFPLYGRWLEEGVETVMSDTSDLVGALRFAAAAHYNLVSTDLHPFIDGNGRTARVLTNALLMMGSVELMQYDLAIPPIPIQRVGPAEKGSPDEYLSALEEVSKTRRLNALEAYLAGRWTRYISQSLVRMYHHVGGEKTTEEDRYFMSVLQGRVTKLDDFVFQLIDGSLPDHPVPNFWESRHIC